MGKVKKMKKGIDNTLKLVALANEAIVLNRSFHLWNGSYGYEVLSELGTALMEKMKKVEEYKPFCQSKELQVCDLETQYIEHWEGDCMESDTIATVLYFEMVDDTRVEVKISHQEDLLDDGRHEYLEYEGLMKVEELEALLKGLTLYHDHLREEMESKGLLVRPEDIAA